MVSMIHTLHLTGCNPVPLAGYLKALGIFRLVAEQSDAEAKGCWLGEHFVLHTRRDEHALMRFFLEEYRPTPILSPWNGRAGFLEGENGENSTRRGAELVRIYLNSRAVRIADYRRLIGILKELTPLKEMNEVRAEKKTLERKKKKHLTSWTEADQEALKKATSREKALKEHLFARLRNELPDDLLEWLDAAVAIGSKRAFAPLLGGSGGAEGSMDLGVNFMDNLLQLFSFDQENGLPTPDSLSWLEQSLFGQVTRLVVSNTAGSLAPGQVGGPNATSGFSRDLSINPWDYVLMFEGTVMFRPTLTRKLESSISANLSYPFTVEPSPVGGGGIAALDDGKTRAGASELWMPIWAQPSTLAETQALLREGSITLRGRRPRNGLDFARCVAQLGLDRGIPSFQRFIFLKRSGDNDLSVPLSRVAVAPTHTRTADLITDLDRAGFLERLRDVARDKDAPNGSKRAVAQLENALFVLTRPGGGRQAVQRALIHLGEVMRTLAASRKGREAVPMLPRPSARWVLQADDGSPEFRIALALSSLDPPQLAMRIHLAPVAYDKGRWIWQPESRLAVWGPGDLGRNLARVVERRIIEANRLGLRSKPFGGHLGARLSDICAFLTRRTDDARIAALLQGLIWAELPNAMPTAHNETTSDPLPSSYALLKPLFTSDDTLKRLDRLPADGKIPLPVEVVRLLTAGSVDAALTLAWRRARIAGLGFPSHPNCAPAAAGVDGLRLLAALAIPLAWGELVCVLPRAEETPEPI